MNAQEKRWINKWLHKIWVVDFKDMNAQLADIDILLKELAKKTNYTLYKTDNLESSK